MALNDLTGQRIKNTYNRLVQTEGGQYADGTGSLLDIASTADIPSTGSLLITASYSDPNLTFTKGDGSQFSIEIEGGGDTGSFFTDVTTPFISPNLIFTRGDGTTKTVDLSTLNTDLGVANAVSIGLLSTRTVNLETSASNALYTASVSLNTITFTKGDGSTFPITVDTGSGIAPGEVVDSLNGLSGSLTLATADSDTLSITETDSSTITLEALPQRRITATVKNVSGGTLTKGTPVHATASASPPAGNVSEVVAAEAQSKFLMPATYVLNEDLDDGDEGQGVLIGFVNGLDTSTFTEGDVVYVAQNGGYTTTKPVGTNFIQNIGVVQKVDATNGSIEVIGAGRVNDVPNMGTGGRIFFSNADGSVNKVLLADQTVTQSLQTDEINFNTSTDALNYPVTFTTTTSTGYEKIYTQGNALTIRPSDGAVRLQNDGTVGGTLNVVGELTGTTADFSGAVTSSDVQIDGFPSVSASLAGIPDGITFDGSTANGLLSYDSDTEIDVSTGWTVSSTVLVAKGNSTYILLEPTAPGGTGLVLTAGSGPGGLNSAIQAGELYYFSSNRYWELADANDETKASSLLAIALEDGKVTMLVQGYAQDTVFGGFTTGRPLYVSTTSGDVTQGAPTATGTFVRKCGYSANGGSRLIFFDGISNDYFENT